jgi:hydrogenase maturation protease
MPGKSGKTLVLGLGNVLMGDEGVGVHAVRALAEASLPEDIECLDGEPAASSCWNRCKTPASSS